MTALQWDQVGERTYETGVDKGVLYLPDSNGDYSTGVAWNGLTTVTETPSGAASTPQYADNIKYLNLVAAELFGATIQAFTYPEEFSQCDGTAIPEPGVTVGQQGRKVFGLCYRTRVGNDIDGTDHGYKLHMVYGCQAAPSQKAYATINDSPAAIDFSWDVSTTPVPVNNLKPTSLITVDSTKVDPTQLATLEGQLYGTSGTDPQLPHPDNVVAIFSGSVSEVRLTDANAPSYDAATHVVTLPAVSHVTWFVDGVETNAGALPAMTVGESRSITAESDPGWVITGDEDWTFDY